VAVQGLNRNIIRLPSGTLAYWLAAMLAAVLSLAAAFAALHGGGTAPSPSAPSVEAERDALNSRIAFFESRATTDPIDFVALNNLSRDYLRRARESGDVADYQRAETAALRSLEILPGENLGGLVNLAAVRIVQHDFSAALDLAQRSIDLKPSDAASHGLLGDALLNLGRYDEAGDAYDRMLSLEPALPALSRQADLAWLQGDVLNAEDFWKQALRFDDGSPRESRAWAMTQLGGLYLATGDLKSAEAQYNAALTTYPDYLHAQAGLGAIRAAQRRWDESISLYAAATTQLPVPQYVAALGDVYARAGRPDEAETQYVLLDVIDRLYRSNGISNDLQLALFYADHGRKLEEALAMAQDAYHAAPSVYAANALAWALYKNNRLEEALVRSDEALRLGTPDAAMHFHAAKIRLALGDRDGAAAHMSEVLSLNPAFSPLHEPEVQALSADLQLGGGR
jgi:tetratricopeptide (TPR) repeat protein